jgi:hypothetical protein
MKRKRRAGFATHTRNIQELGISTGIPLKENTVPPCVPGACCRSRRFYGDLFGRNPILEHARLLSTARRIVGSGRMVAYPSVTHE